MKLFLPCSCSLGNSWSIRIRSIPTTVLWEAKPRAAGAVGLPCWGGIFPQLSCESQSSLKCRGGNLSPLHAETEPWAASIVSWTWITLQQKYCLAYIFPSLICLQSVILRRQATKIKWTVKITDVLPCGLNSRQAHLLLH